ncbi:penicillin-binding protein 1C [Chitinibacter tainanensis]|uniref:penicillin-binding protein 1C n=1 Tax=Chitinibacter tainanensis TaxID=230667 RepID=UPI0003FF4F07|nr:penicillin-binding protein 1C [Chitinibacter tainanensis]
MLGLKITGPRAWGVGLAALLLASQMALANPSFREVRAAWRSSDVLVLDRQGQPLQRLRVDMQQRRLDWVALADISPAMRYALVVSEDRRFYQHSGVDWSGVAAAAWANLWNTRTRGASTLTMQLAGLLDADLRAGQQGRSLWQKVGQGWSASWLETHWQKSEILEAYLNLVSFRGELVGLSALSHTLFGKLPRGLNATEAAIAAALLRGPNADVARVASRACKILQDMAKPQPCSTVRVETEMALSRSRAGNALAEHDAPHFARKLLAQRPLTAGSTVRSTVSLPLQRFATAALQRHLAALAKRNVQDGAVVVLDNASGDILAWVGSAGAGLSNAAEVDGVTALRQAGSTLKPFLYQLAIERRYLTAASLLDDSPLDLQTAGGLYAPQNYAKDFKGLVSVRSALGASLNVPAVRTIEMVSPTALRDRLAALGLSSLQQDGDYYGASLALGAADVRLLELTNSYRTLANGGQSSALRWLRTDPLPRRQALLSPASSFIVADILADRTARVRTFGLESALSTRYWSAVKTGTSKDMRDNWTIGFSRQFTVGVWVGNASGEPMWDVSGMHGAAPVWLAVLDRAQQTAPASRAPAAPAGVTQRTVHYQNQIEASRVEWFLAGTERELIVAETQAIRNQAPGIISPLDGSIYAVDPDVPPKHQRVMLRARGVSQPQWLLDGKLICRANPCKWFPWPGRHQLELRDGRGAAIESVKFEVRGAFLRPPASAPKSKPVSP